MSFLKTKARLLVCAVIIVSFFIPAYNGVSGFSFINYAFSEAKNHADISQTDVFLAVIPLLLIPCSASIILLSSYLHRSLRKTYLAMPLLFMLFFFGIIFLGARGSSSEFSSPRFIFYMQPGFYFTGLACVALIFTKTYKKKRRRRSSSSSAAETVPAT